MQPFAFARVVLFSGRNGGMFMSFICCVVHSITDQKIWLFDDGKE